MKPTASIHAVYNVEPGYALLKYPFNAKMNAVLKKYPGCKWSAPRHNFMVPNEIASGFLEYGKKTFGWSPVTTDSGLQNFELESQVNPACFAYQREDIVRALKLKRAMLAWEMGLGKTLGGIEFMRLSNSSRCIVVCPAMARGVWEDDLAKWWPDHHPITVIRDGKAAANFALEASASYICIISYELLKKLRLPSKVDCVVADESHYIKEAKVARSKALREILDKWNVNYRLFLTGTPITINPIDIHHQADSLYPGRMGNVWAFGDTYCGRVPNSYRYRGYDYDGVNTLRAEELYTRLSSFIFRRTKAEVADQLPKLITRTIKLKPDRSFAAKIDAALKSGEGLDAILESAGNSKIDPLVALTEEDFEGGTTHACLLTYFQATADEVAGRLEDAIGGWDIKPIVFHVDGKVPEKKRQAIIAEAKKTPHAILVTTMKAVNVGINLTKFSPATFVELYGAPGIMGQAAGRFHRVGGESTTPYVRFAILEGTEEERIASTLERRMKEHGKVMARGHIDAAIIDALEEETETPGEFLKRIRAAMNATAKDDDCYA